MLKMHILRYLIGSFIVHCAALTEAVVVAVPKRFSIDNGRVEIIENQYK